MREGDINWFDRSVNLVAKSVNPFREDWFVSENLKKLYTVKPTRILMNEAVDLADWKLPWAIKTMFAMQANRQNTYLFLTQKPHSYIGWRLFEEENIWCGFSLTGNPSIQKELIETIELEPLANWFLHLDLCDEPRDLAAELALGAKWIVFTAADESEFFSRHTLRKRASSLLAQADAYNVPVFMEDSMKRILKPCMLRKDLPHELKN